MTQKRTQYWHRGELNMWNNNSIKSLISFVFSVPRGAEIIENLRQKQIEHRKEHEKDVLIKIKRKMEKIRATQQKMLRPVDKPTHFDGKFKRCELRQRIVVLKNLLLRMIV